MEWDCTSSRPLYRHSWSPDRWQGCLLPTHNPRLRLPLRAFPAKIWIKFFGQLVRFLVRDLPLARAFPTVHRPSSRLRPHRPGRSRSCRRSRLTRAGFPILAGWRAGQFSWLSSELQLEHGKQLSAKVGADVNSAFDLRHKRQSAAVETNFAQI